MHFYHIFFVFLLTKITNTNECKYVDGICKEVQSYPLDNVIGGFLTGIFYAFIFSVTVAIFTIPIYVFYSKCERDKINKPDDPLEYEINQFSENKGENIIQ